MTQTHVMRETSLMIPIDSITPARWYKQFWPWFLITLPTVAVIASFVSLSIAIKNADTPVHDDYSKNGFAIQHDTRADNLAMQKNMHADIAIENNGRVNVELRSDQPAQRPLLTLHCIHPFDAHNDITIALARSGENSYSGMLPTTLHGKWKIELRAPAENWRLASEIDLQPGLSSRLSL